METKPEIEIYLTDRHFIYFDDLSRDIVLQDLSLTGPAIAIDHDLEILAENDWAIHIDMWFTDPGIARVLTRTSFKATCDGSDVWSDNLTEVYLAKALELTRDAYNEQCKIAGIRSILEDSFFSYELVADVLELFNNSLDQRDLYFGEDEELYVYNQISFPPGPNTTFVMIGTFAILDQVLFTNSSYRRTENLAAIEKLVPLQTYNTVKLKGVKSQHGETVILNLKQSIAYILLIQLALSLLLTQYDRLKEGLEKAGMKEAMVDKYITNSTAFMNTIRKSYTDNGVIITNFDNPIDWLEIIH